MGLIKKKGQEGTAVTYISRNQALKKLQLNLSSFRRLCILKGVYPREPLNKKKAGKGSTAPRTYYYRKDIQFLLHEPLVGKFREYRVYQQKLKKAISKKEWAVAKSIEINHKPEFRLDHIIKERYPTFIDAIRDLDDALSMIFLFSTLASHDKVPSLKLKECHRLSSEFQAFVATTNSLRKVFVSIKGIYYQADIRGQEITWIVPHQFTQDVPTDVDFRIMATFLDLYISLLGFVNFKLYMDANYSYPPKRDSKLDSRGAGLTAFLLENTNEDILDNILDNKGEEQVTEKMSKKQAKLLQKQAMTSINEKIATIAAKVDDAEVDQPTEMISTVTHIGIQSDESNNVPTLTDLTSHSEFLTSFKLLFKGCKFWLSREVPNHSLTFIIKSFGGQVSSDNDATFSITDTGITHHIIDRPLPSDSAKPEWMNYGSERDYIQPQWLYDCVNAKRIIGTRGYQAGETLPPHLSPFEVYEEGDYVPEEVSAIAVAKGMEGEIEMLDKADVIVREKIDSKEVAQPVMDEELPDEEADDDENEVSSDEEMYQEELKAEAAGLTYSEYMQGKEKDAPNKRKMADAAPAQRKVKKTKVQRDADAAVEKKELAKMMMTKRDKRLYDQIQFGKDKKQVENQKLEQKREKAKKSSRAGWNVEKK